MMTIAEIRRSNLRLLVESHGGQSALAAAIDRSPAHLWQVTSGERNIGEVFARNVERRLGLPPAWMDAPHEAADGTSVFPEESWNMLPPEAKALIHLVIEYYRNKGALNRDEEALLRAFRSTSREGQRVVIEVAKAQSAASKPSRARRVRSNSTPNPDARKSGARRLA